jgi:hypothetical protein
MFMGCHRILSLAFVPFCPSFFKTSKSSNLSYIASNYLPYRIPQGMDKLYGVSYITNSFHQRLCYKPNSALLPSQLDPHSMALKANATAKA